MRSVVGDDVGDDVVDVGVDEAGAGEGGAQLVHQRPEPPVEGPRQLVRELSAGRAGRRVRLPLVRDAADRPHVRHHHRAGVQEVQPLPTQARTRHRALGTATAAFELAGAYRELLAVLGDHGADEGGRRRRGALRHGEDGREVVADEVVGARGDGEERAPQQAHRRHLPVPGDQVVPAVGVVVDLGVQVQATALSETADKSD